MKKTLIALALILPQFAFAGDQDILNAKIQAAKVLSQLRDATRMSSPQAQIKAMCRLADQSLQIADPDSKGLGPGIASTLLGTFGSGIYWENDQSGILAFADLTSSIIVSKFYELLAGAGEWESSVSTVQSAGTGKVKVYGKAGKINLQLVVSLDTGKISDVTSNGISLVNSNRGVFQKDLRSVKSNPNAVSLLVKKLTTASVRDGGLPILCP